MPTLPWLDPRTPDQAFPPVEHALREPNGLLAVAGDLHPQRLLAAYRHGIFPWYEDGQPILWWSPDPRAVLFADEFRLHRSLRKRLRNSGMRVTLDTQFRAVMQACGAPRDGQNGTWITPDMLTAYDTLHRLGYAHCAETWDRDGHLVGGLYGLAIGRVFFGESMFSRVADASKIALATLVCQLQNWGFEMIDCQQATGHLMRFGAREIPRAEFVQRLQRDCAREHLPGPWQLQEHLHVDQWNPLAARR
ncbi:leucyl/phenylalanyl-tRNA--protein transferase [Acidihalobacter ferrooxydans]|uniref:Leucyl/phenylalanyl-tRNA--protein transferase n=1 Tax=Acidihalobacter ferrooxydans TaxID=1765967 RepID=A0A1P8UHV3_9GAMM|nr:leucyl/phenylalanyl-tRNA--protein transferase [Acidihalobacter ferrooxydans]APZ43423.1 leucyl/phenylalanyl-tRNA--protein transferase [Acidihalobacter ferrooxydans]